VSVVSVLRDELGGAVSNYSAIRRVRALAGTVSRGLIGPIPAKRQRVARIRSSSPPSAAWPAQVLRVTWLLPVCGLFTPPSQV